MDQHSDQQWHLLTVESMLAQLKVQMISRHLYIFSGRIFRKEKQQKTMATTKSFNWKNSLAGTLRSITPPLSVLVQSQKKYCHQFKRKIVFVS